MKEVFSDSTKKIDENLLILLSITYAGISSKVVGGIRVADIILFIIFFRQIRQPIPNYVIRLFLLWCVALLCSLYMGVSLNQPFVLSDLRYFIVVIVAFYCSVSLAFNKELDYNYLLFRMMLFTLIIYFIIPFSSAIRFFYVDSSFQKDEHLDTVFGPPLVLIDYCFIFLTLSKPSRPLKFYLTYLGFVVLIFILRKSRTNLVVSLLLVGISLVFRNGVKLKFKQILTLSISFVVAVLGISFSGNERLQNVLNPEKDTSFLFRVISNGLFLDEFEKSSLMVKLFGFGVGSQISITLNEYLGEFSFFVLDNGPLTIVMKLGVIGFLIYLVILIRVLKGIAILKKIILLLPLIISFTLNSYSLYKFVYLLGFTLASISLITYEKKRFNN